MQYLIGDEGRKTHLLSIRYLRYTFMMVVASLPLAVEPCVLSLCISQPGCLGFLCR